MEYTPSIYVSIPDRGKSFYYVCMKCKAKTQNTQGQVSVKSK